MNLKSNFSSCAFIFILLLSPFTIAGSLQNAFALTPVADLTGQWSGFAQIYWTEMPCQSTGTVNGYFTQDGNNLSGEFTFVPTSTTATVPDYEYCPTAVGSEPWDIVPVGTIDGSRIELYDHFGITFSGWYASSGIKLDFSSEWYTGTTQLSPTGFSPPPFEPEEEEDTDGDGISDDEDECIGLLEDYYGENEEDGCPEKDSDNDTIYDYEDSCPYDPEDFIGIEDGCPEEEEDTDGDSFYDNEDVCPYDAEDYFKFGELEGCPETDTDDDNIYDSIDECIYEPEDTVGDTDGCPNQDEFAEDEYDQTPLVSDPEKLDTLISEHVTNGLLWNGIDSTGLAKELLKLPPDEVIYVLSQERGLFGHADKIAAAYISLLTDDQIENLPSELFDKLRGSVDDWWRTNWDKAQLNRLDSAFDGKKTSFEPQTSNDDPENPVVFINGVRNTKEDHDKSCQKLANALGRECVGFYNLSEGAYGDTIESAKGKFLNFVPPSGQELQMYIAQRLSQNKPIEIHAHSQGAIIVSTALNDPEIQRLLKEHPHMVTVHTHGGASWTFPDGVDYRHDVFRSDKLAGPFGKAWLPVEANKIGGPNSWYALNHAMDLYTENYPKFTIKQFSKFGYGIDALALADYLTTRTPTEAQNVIQAITDQDTRKWVEDYYQTFKQ